ncbi:MAG TPA: addiction module protein [Gemmataceae bacterium]|nr:addiction module protein [Gemmataceae bacterium]
MSPHADELLAKILRLPDEEQTELVERLLDALGPPESAIDRMTDEEFAAELARRAEEARRDPSVLIPWDQVRDMR